MLAALILFATWILLGFPAAIVLFPWTLITGDVGPLYRTAMSIVRIGLHLAGIGAEAEWRAPLDRSQACLFLSNHVSNLDPPILFPLIPFRVTAFVKRSLMKIPVLG